MSSSSSSSKKRPSAAGGLSDDVRKLLAKKLKESKKPKDEQKLLAWTEEEWKAWKSAPSSSEIEGSDLIVMKAPISSLYETQLAKGEQLFTVDSFCESMTESGTVCQCIIDAVPDQDQYIYTREEVYKEWDLEHVQLPIEPSQKEGLNKDIIRFVAPSREQVATFIKSVGYAKEEDQDAKIAVTSSLGFNRAGLLICSYLVEVKKMKLDAALDLFAKCRPPGIYTRSCVQALQRRYGPSLTLTVPAAPAWDVVAISSGAAKSTETTLPPLNSPVPSGATKPASAQVSAQSPNPPAPWQKNFSKRENREYFFNPVTKKSVWKIEDCK